jgi:hypothetical protein
MTKNYLARIPERSKGTVLRAVAYASWVRIPLRAYYKIVREDLKLKYRYGLVAMMPDFQSGDRGSIPRSDEL